MTEYLVWLQDLGKGDVERVGGKNASLGEMISKLSSAGVRVTEGFATSADAYREFLSNDGLQARIDKALSRLDIEDVSALARAGASIREWIGQSPLQPALETEIRQAYRVLGETAGAEPGVAVRSSATAEDLSDASFAGQQETYLNVQGIDAVLRKVKLVFASLYNDRAIAYRAHHGYQDHGIALSVGVQKTIRSDPCLPRPRQICGDLWSGALRPPGPGQMADGRRHRQRFPKPRYGGGNLVVFGWKKRELGRL